MYTLRYLTYLLLFFPALAFAITFDHPGEQSAIQQIKLLPQLLKKLPLPFPDGCEPVIIIEGPLASKNSHDAAAICKFAKPQTDETQYAFLVFFLDSEKTQYRLVAQANHIIESGGRDLPFSGTPSIKNRVLTLDYETSGTGCYSSFTHKWRYEVAQQFELIGYSEHESCVSEANNSLQSTSNSVDINLKTATKIINNKNKCKLSGDIPKITINDANTSDISLQINELSCEK